MGKLPHGADRVVTVSLTELLRALPAANKSKIGRVIRRQKKYLAQEWCHRHSQAPFYAKKVLGELRGWEEYSSRYVHPLLYTLFRGFSSGDERYLYVYSGERRRFFSQEVRKSGGTAEFDAILAADRKVFAGVVGDALGADLASVVAEILEAAHARLIPQSHAKAVKIAMIGDCVMTEIQHFLEPLLFDDGVGLEAQGFYFSARNKREYNDLGVAAWLDGAKFDLISMSFFTFEGLPLYTALLREAAKGLSSRKAIDEKCDALLALVDRYIVAVREKTNAPIMLHGCSGLPLERVRGLMPLMPEMSPGKRYVTKRLDEGLAAMARGIENVILIDERKRVLDAGLRNANKRLLPRTVTHGGLFHPSIFGTLVAEDYAHIIRAYVTIANVKVLLVDFDNTLWKGVMADGDVEHYVEEQKLLQQLMHAGILLVALSKNDPKNIRWNEMILQPDDFVLQKIRWDSKAQSVLSVTSELDLDPKSFMLLDDNPVEREIVVSQVPGVKALDPTNPTTWAYLRLLQDFPATRQTEEARLRTAMYRESAIRREAQSANLDHEAMMRSLELRVGWRRAGSTDLDRLHELISRTNQFNTTTIRYSAAELRRLTEAPDYRVYVATLSDKFGSLGIVGTSICRLDADTLTYESVVMSCRAMGFGLETVLVAKPLSELPDIRNAVGKFVPTERNNPCASLFLDCGFEGAEDGSWRLDLKKGAPVYPDWFAFEELRSAHEAVAAQYRTPLDRQEDQSVRGHSVRSAG